MPQCPGPGQIQLYGPPSAGLGQRQPPGRGGPTGPGGRGVKRSRADALALGGNVNKRPRQAVPAQPPVQPPAPITSVAVMDVGQGNCNLVLAGAEPKFFFDTGMPLWFFTGTAPPRIFANVNPPDQGPIVEKHNQTTIPVILSHWDWDHWRLARAWQRLGAGQWTVPLQPRGPSANNFFLTLNQPNVIGPFVNPNAAAQPQANVAHPLPQAGYTIYRCHPPDGAPHDPGMVMNNSGLAVSVPIQTPPGTPLPPPAPARALLTADANFNSLPPVALIPQAAYTTAVHHGSRAHGASENLIEPPQPIANAGRIAYSSGRRGTLYAYGFPVQESLDHYRQAGWTQERSTAEGATIRQPGGAANRGNVRMGDQTPLADYQPSCFAVFRQPNQLP